MPVLLLLVVLTGACVLRREHPDAQQSGPRVSDSESSAQLDGLVNDVCTKSVVLLGEEGHHAGGHTVEVKSELVKRLIERCGFNAVYFESSAYEFYDLNRRLAAGTSAREQVADAIGGLWSTSNAIDPLVAYLYTQASVGRIRLAGLDPQLGTATSS
jgi:erythromycin esterase-like protein